MMVAIAPFRALRYNRQHIGELSRVLAPPYDVISLAEQEQLYQSSPYNVVRLVYGKQFPDDREGSNRYTRAKETFEEWRKTRVLVRDEQAALYVCDHRFRWQGASYRRLGFVALLEFEGSVPGGVLRHESTFEAPKADRAQLIDAVRAHLSPVFCVAPDPDGRLYALLDRISRGQAPLESARFRDDELHLVAITDPDVIASIRGHLAQARVLIADGHHRFEVALSRRRLCPAVMTYFAVLGDPALVVRPIHRVIRPTSGAEASWQAGLESLCRLEPMSSLEPLMRWLTEAQGQGRFGYYGQGRCYGATLREDRVAAWCLRACVPLALAGLDVTLLHHLILPELEQRAGQRPGGPAILSNAHPCQYTPDPAEALALAKQTAGSCAWFLRGLPLPQVFSLAAQGLTLPQKSTYFYPKVLSGLCINPFD